MSKLKLAYFGDGPWSHEAFLQLAEREGDDEILLVAPRFDHKDPELCRFAQERELDIRFFENVNAPEALPKIR